MPNEYAPGIPVAPGWDIGPGGEVRPPRPFTMGGVKVTPELLPLDVNVPSTWGPYGWALGPSGMPERTTKPPATPVPPGFPQPGGGYPWGYTPQPFPAFPDISGLFGRLQPPTATLPAGWTSTLVPPTGPTQPYWLSGFPGETPYAGPGGTRAGRTTTSIQRGFERMPLGFEPPLGSTEYTKMGTQTMYDDEGKPYVVPVYGRRTEVTDITETIEPPEGVDELAWARLLSEERDRARTQNLTAQDMANDLAIALATLGLSQYNAQVAATNAANQLGLAIEREKRAAWEWAGEQARAAAEFKRTLQLQYDRLTYERGRDEADRAARLVQQLLGLWPSLSLSGRGAARDALSLVGMGAMAAPLERMGLASETAVTGVTGWR